MALDIIVRQIFLFYSMNFDIFQVFRIRSELRKRKMQNVSVERVFNVQGNLFFFFFCIKIRIKKKKEVMMQEVESVVQLESIMLVVCHF
jgi:hypothetical protein